MSRLSCSYDKEYVDDNDCFLKFLIAQKHMFSKVVDDIKNKLYQTISYSHKEVTDGHKERILASRKKIAEVDILLTDREKIVKK